MHTQSSRIYRDTRIPAHTQQCAASMRVLMYFHGKYPLEATQRHHERILGALLHIEASLH